MAHNSRERNPLVLWIGSAALVTLVRVLGATSPDYDLGIQLQAAQNLFVGNGLSFYSFYQSGGPNLGDPVMLVTLTSFPAGYSLAAAVLMAVGFHVGAIVRILGAAGTMLGWWGWGRLAVPFFRDGLRRGSPWSWGGGAIALATPLLFTPGWGGTDIFLWAAVPWVLESLIRASDESTHDAWLRDLLAGAVCGLAFQMRYASLFLTVYAAAVILWQSRLRVPILMRRWAVFSMGVLPAVAVQGYINYVLSNVPAKPGGLFSVAANSAGRRLWEGVFLLDAANYAWAFWFPGIVLARLFPTLRATAGAVSWQLGVTIVALLVLVVAARRYSVSPMAASRDVRVLAAGLFVMIPLTLLACMSVGVYNYVADLRYYTPIVPLAVFVAYSLASTGEPPTGTISGRCLRAIGMIYVLGYIGLTSVYVSLLVAPGRIGHSERQKLMASEVHDWPSMAITYELSPARRFVMQLLKERPGVLLLTSRPGAFHWDAAVDRSKLYSLNCEGLHATYLDGPANIVIDTFDQGQPQDLWYFRYTGRHGHVARSHCFEQLSDLKLVRRFSEEGLKVLEARIDAGKSVSLKP